LNRLNEALWEVGAGGDTVGFAGGGSSELAAGLVSSGVVTWPTIRCVFCKRVPGLCGFRGGSVLVVVVGREGARVGCEVLRLSVTV